MRKALLALTMYFFVSGISAQNVGVGTTSPASKVDVSGDLALREGTAITVASGNNRITLPAAKNSVYRLTGASGAFTLNSISAGNDGMTLTLINATGQVMTVRDSASIRTNIGADLSGTTTVASVTMIYNATLAKWIVTSSEGFNTSSANQWNTTGNSGTTAGTNFIGTTDTKALEFKVNNLKSGYIDWNAGIGNTGFGYGTFNAISSGSDNAAFGYNSMGSNTSGSDNIAMGFAALNSNTTGNNNTALGEGAMSNNTTASYNTAVGWNAMQANTTGNNNLAVGHYTLHNDSTGSGNVVLGEDAMSTNYNGSFNTVVGYDAGLNATGSNNVFIGNQVGYNELGSNKLYIANSNTATPLIYGDFNNKHLTINDSLTGKYFQMINGATNGYMLQSDASGNAKWVNPSTIAANNIYNSDGTLTGNRTVAMGGDNLYFTTTGGKIGIGTISPGASLDVSGNMSAGTGNTNSGTYTLIAGNNNTISGGQASAVFGSFNAASADHVAVFGDHNIASGLNSWVAGYLDTVSGYHSMAMGDNNNVSAGWSMATGSNNKVSTGGFDFAMGSSNSITGSYSAAFGSSNAVTGSNSAAFGSSNTVTNGNSAVFGSSNTQSGSNSLLVGNSLSLTAGNGSLITGSTNTGSADHIAVFGDHNIATAYNAVVGGYSDTVSGVHSVAMGQNNNVSGAQSATFGSSNTAAGNNTFVSGNNNNAPSFNEVTLGMNATTYTASSSGSYSATDRILDIGNGSSSSSRSDALTVLKNGNVGIGNNAPAKTLQVNGTTSTTNFQMTNGGTGGYVLQSDASGNATWVNPTSLSSSYWTLSGSSLYNNSGTSIGIGTATPNATLDVESSSSALYYTMAHLFTPNNDINGNHTQIRVGVSATTNNSAELRFGYQGNGSTSNTAELGLLGGLGLVVTGAGNVGIGTSSPSSALQVNGTTSTTNFQMTNGGTSGYLLQSDASGNGTWVSPSSASANIYNSDGTLTGNRTVTMGSDNLTFNSTTGNFIVNPSSTGNVGVGNNAPPAKLSVLASGNAASIPNSTSTGVFRVGVGSGEGIDFGKASVGPYAAWMQVGYNGGADPLVIQPLGGNVGIGNINPGATLDVTGNTRTVNFEMTNGASNGYLLQSDGSGNGTWVSPSSIAATNIYNSDGTLTGNRTVTMSGNNLGFDGGNVGIGTNSPVNTLQVEGNLHMDGNPIYLRSDPADQNDFIKWNSTADMVDMAGWNGINLGYNSTGTEVAVLTVSGTSVGIGTTSPSHTLQVNGTTSTTNFQMTNGGTSGYLLQSDASGNGTWVSPSAASTNIYNSDGTLTGNRTVTMGSDNLTFSGSGSIAMGSSLTSSGSSSFATGNGNTVSGNYAFVTGNDNVVTAPYSMVSGLGNRDGGTDDIVGGFENVVVAGYGHSLAIGYLDSIAGSSGAVFGVGNKVRNYEGFAQGDGNNVPGQTAAAFGSSNTATGAASFVSGGNNTTNATYSFATGNNNTAGSYAEMAIGMNGTTYTPSNTGGYSATDRIFDVGNGSSSGSRSDAMTILKNGNVGIGNNSPTSTLQVNGATSTTNFQMTNGGTSGYILKSDASGNGTWVSPSTIGTTNTLSLSINTLTSTVNGVAATSNAVSTVSNIATANTFSTVVNGVSASSVNVINTNVLSLSGDSMTSTINGIASNKLSLSGSNWSLTGNKGTTAGTDFIGTTDGQPLEIKVNNNKAGYIDYSGSGNTSLGYQAANAHTTGYSNVAMGYQALQSSTTGNTNTAIGTYAMQASTVDSQNVAVGFQALNLGSNNIGIGYYAGTFDTGSNNIFVGTFAGNFTGSNNTMIGSNAGYFTNGAGNVFLGNSAGYNEGGSNKLYIANSSTATPLIYGDFTNQHVTVNDSLTSQYFQMTNGAASGDFLKSDANGHGTWTALTSATVPNIYTADGTLTGNRTVTMGADNLTLSSTTGNLIFNPSSTGEVGIGTAAPNGTLDVLASGGKEVMLGGGSNTGSEVKFAYNGVQHFSIYNSGNNKLTFAQTSSSITPNQAGTALMTIDGSANVSIPSGTMAVGTASTPGKFNVNGNAVIGASLTSRSGSGLTVDYSNATTYAANTDATDAARGLSIVNEGSTASSMAVLSMRSNANGGANNQMLDMKLVNPNNGTSSLIYSFGPNATFTDRFTMTSAGDFGIGTTIPIYPLDVTGNLRSTTSAYLATSSGSVGVGTTSPESQLANTATNIIGNDGHGVNTGSLTWAMNIDGYTEALYNASVNTGAQGLAVKIAGTAATNRLLDLSTGAAQATAGTSVMVVEGSGNVGVGTGSPSTDLSFGGDVARTVGMERTTGTTGFGLTVQAGGAKSGTTDKNGGNLTLSGGITTGNGNAVTPGSNILFLTATPLGSSSTTDVTPSEKVRITGAGYVGIGTTSPAFPLDVAATLITSESGYGYLNASGNTGTASSSNVAYSIHSAGRIYTAEVDVASDRRVKTNINTVEPTSMLDKANALSVVNYNYIDKLTKGKNTKTGFIAQEVEAVMPDAINKTTDVIPNVFAPAEKVQADGTTLTVTTATAHGFTAGDEVLLYDKGNHPYHVHVASVISEKVFTVNDWTEKVDNIFVYGKRVNDFRTADFDQITAVAIGAVQELSKRTQALEKENAALKAMNEKLQSSDTDQTKLIQTMKAQIDAINVRLNMTTEK